MHKQARLPEIFDQILQNTPVLETPPPPLWVLTFQNPPQLKFRQILALWVLTFQNHPPPPIEI